MNKEQTVYLAYDPTRTHVFAVFSSAIDAHKACALMYGDGTWCVKAFPVEHTSHCQGNAEIDGKLIPVYQGTDGVWRKAQP